MMDQQGLPVYCAGIFLAFLGRLAIEVAEGFWMQVAVNAAGLLALVLIAVVSAWSKEKPRTPRPALPALPSRPRASIIRVNLSIRGAVVGPAGPATSFPTGSTGRASIVNRSL